MFCGSVDFDYQEVVCVWNEIMEGAVHAWHRAIRAASSGYGQDSAARSEENHPAIVSIGPTYFVIACLCVCLFFALSGDQRLM